MAGRLAAANAYSVQAKQWKKWSNTQRHLFNDVYFVMGEQKIFLHPKDKIRPDEHWNTIRWNAAFTAAAELSD